ncbi:MAG: HD domain-containing protein [Nitrososphaerales archaeon]|jgi:putative nucleotidyltransferase with HDIG domain
MNEPNDIDAFSAILPSLNLIKDAKIRSDTAEVYMQLLRESKWPNLEKQPVASFLKTSGVEHVKAVVEICTEVAKVLESSHSIKVNMDFLISGAILHDASKLVEYEPTSDGEKATKIGEMGQHTLSCVRLMFSKKMPEEIIHIVLAHTPKSSVIPKTVESVILYYADCTDYNVLRLVDGKGPDIRK